MGENEVKWVKNGFPDEIITDILTRLPAKSLHRFKCVSKSWNSLIKSTHFISSYISHHSQSWVILDHLMRIHESKSTDSVTQFTLKFPPNVSTFSVDLNHLAFEPISEIYPSVLDSSNGIFLFHIRVKRNPNEHKQSLVVNGRPHFDKRFQEDDLFLANPVTKEWVPLPKPPYPIFHGGTIGYTTRINNRSGVLERFLVCEYQPLMGSDVATLMCFSSDIGKWVTKDANFFYSDMPFILEWGCYGAFEFEGHIFWYDINYGLIVWDDPFGDLDKERKVECRFIHLPLRPFTMKIGAEQRSVGVGGGHILFLEMFKEGEGQGKWLYLYRLRDCQAEGLNFDNWILTHRVSWKNVFWMKEGFLGGGLGNVMPTFSFFHPWDVDVVFFHVRGRVFSYNLRTRKVESCSDPYSSVIDHVFLMPYVMPSWPTSLPKCLDATFLKEQGNHHFKAKRYNEALICYSRSIALSPNALAYANRAMAYLKVNRHPEAEDDCTKALKLDSEYFKAYWRRATARKELGDLKGYAEDLESALKLQPDNQELENQYTEVKALLEKVKLSETVPAASAVQNNPSIIQDHDSEGEFSHGSAA